MLIDVGSFYNAENQSDVWIYVIVSLWNPSFKIVLVSIALWNEFLPMRIYAVL